MRRCKDAKMRKPTKYLQAQCHEDAKMRCCEDARHRLCPPSATVLVFSVTGVFDPFPVKLYKHLGERYDMCKCMKQIGQGLAGRPVGEILFAKDAQVLNFKCGFRKPPPFFNISQSARIIPTVVMMIFSNQCMS